MKKVALITNYNIFDKANAAMKVAEQLSGHSCSLLVYDSNREKISKVNKSNIPFEYMPPDDLYNEADIVVVLGGDGSILDAARRVAAKATPILGINLGRIGYMAELDLDEIDLLDRIFTDDYTLDSRYMLNVEIIGKNGKVKKSTFALNDAVISNGSVSRIVDLELSENGTPITTYRADGIIVATPTGSTAYSMSAGGAIADPRIQCMCVTPICPHSLSARPMIFPDVATIEIKNICQRERLLYLTVDGRINFELYRNETVKVCKSELKTNLISMKNRSFYSKLREKMKGHN